MERLPDDRKCPSKSTLDAVRRRGGLTAWKMIVECIDPRTRERDR